jgi:hypothetical protein
VSASPPAAGPVVGVLERRGKFMTVEPFFHRGRRMNVERSRARPGDLVLVSPLGPRSGHARVLKRIGRPDVARDVIEAMLLDRGLRRRFEPHVENAARDAASQPVEVGTRLDLRASVANAGPSSPCSWTWVRCSASAAWAISSSPALTNTPTSSARRRMARAIPAATAGSTARGDGSQRMKPSAQAPSSVASSASSRRVMPQTLTRVTRPS